MNKHISPSTPILERRGAAWNGDDDAVLDRLALTPEAAFAWHDPRESLTIYARGEGYRHSADGADRFEALGAACSRLEQQLVQHGLEARPAPLALVGFSFDARTPGASWRGWPAAELWVPDEMWVRSPQGAWHLTLAGAPLAHPRGAGVATARGRETSLRRQAWPDREAWCGSVAEAQRAMRGGALHKAVLARQLELEAPHGCAFDPLDSFRALREQAGQARTFAWCRGDAGAFVGASPETLVAVDGQALRTHALAGTRGRAALAADDEHARRALAADPKELQEHRWVVDGIASRLAPLCHEVDVADAPAVMTLPRVHHLHTPIAARLREGHSVFDALAALHPTAALGGAPRQEASAFLARHEPLERGWYGAPIGWVGGGQARLGVAIRSALLRGERALAFAGAGIVTASQPEAEWRETEMKLETVLAGLRASTTRRRFA